MAEFHGRLPSHNKYNDEGEQSGESGNAARTEMTDLKGSKCRCGFALNTKSIKCPKCGKNMKPAEWADEGTIISCVKVGFPPEGECGPMNIALVQVTGRGPKVICWTDVCFSTGDAVTISEPTKQRYLCQKAPCQTTVKP